jgi:flagellar biosynthetic protein FliP
LAAVPRPSRFSLGRFVRHYLEMVLAMAVGMVVYGMLFRGGMLSRSYADQALMAAFMSAPMVAWMRHRGHSWRQAAEMVGAMLLPAAAVVAAAGGQPAVSDRALALASHAAMLVGMLGLMVVRRDEYGHAGACPRTERAEDALTVEV